MKRKGNFSFLLACVSIIGLYSLSAHALVRVGFIALRNAQGQLVQLETDFKYAHIAVAVGDRWLHAYPPKGVQISSSEDLENIGDIALVLESAEIAELTAKVYGQYLNKPYDPYFSWSNERIYCAELVAKLLDIKPTPMHFDSKYWSSWYQQYEGLPGSSPGKIYRELLQQGFYPVKY